ncbi:MAG: RNA polymerase subunit sigma-24 [Crocinitomicaceae bacterium]|nr:RNA polymerase subunit sigma-24 [Crocinitomicaceae bacterium]|tara:strand:- start:24843 stop:25418 length:576 start_codon:yes stop_codon:yes gene_type:complete
MEVSQKIIKSCVKNDRMAQQELYKLCYGPLLSICMRYKHNKEDGVAILNDAFLKILTNLKDLGNDVPFEAWIKRITINCCINDYRKNKNKPKLINVESESFLDILLPIDDEEIDEADQGISIQKLRTLLAELPNSSQEVFQLYILEGYNHAEIGGILNISEGTSKWHLNNARKILRTKLKERFNITRKVAL